jgi:hypothetical protein
MHSIMARRDCDMPLPSCRVVPASMALWRRLPIDVTASSIRRRPGTDLLTLALRDRLQLLALPRFD